MKFWHSNRLDQEAEHDPADVARQFIAACRDGWEGLDTSRPSMEFCFRWWLTDPNGLNAVWDEEDWDLLWAGLGAVITDADLDFIWSRLTPDLREAPSA